jgi:hypothetical protein
MIDKNILIQQIDSLEKLADKIEKNMEILTKSAKLKVTDFSPYKIEEFQSPYKELNRETIRDYQKWYSMSLVLIVDIFPEKEAEFKVHYSKHGYYGGEGVFELVQFDRYYDTAYETLNDKFIEFRKKFEIQRSIVGSIPDIFLIKEINLREIISAAFVDREIDEAEYMYLQKHYRCAGALAGVALEQHLRFFCDKFGLKYDKKDTIEPLVQKLYENKKIDIETMKNIQHLATIRDTCAHAGDVDPNKVKELIERVKKFL